MNGNISATGITRDLEAMKRVGVSGFQIFQVGSGIVKGLVDYGSPEHLRLLQHAAREASRLGLEFAMHNCPGWSSSGGPWVKPELSMQTLTWSETAATGGQRVQMTLRQPYAARTYYRDAMVLAFPALGGEQVQPTRISSNSGPVNAALLNAGDPAGGVEIRPAAESQPAYLQLEYAAPFEARSITILSAPLVAPGAGRGAGAGFGQGGFGAAPAITLEASDDGVQFRRVAEIGGGGFGGRRGVQLPSSTNFRVTRARYFRLVTTQARRIAEVRLSGTGRIVDWTSKANFGSSRGGFGMLAAAAPPAEPPGGPVIDPASVLDITRFMDAQGRLDWQAPAGDWVIVRIGQTTTGVENHPGPDGGVGLEVDKFSKEAYDFHFNQFFGKLFDVIAPLAAKGLAAAIIDSYETGMQNWTARFPQEFQQRRGYDLKKYMPAMLGRVAGSAEISERFLWDVRKTQAELMDENYYGRFAEDLRQRGMRCFIEPYSPGNFDEMPAGSYADMPMGEFWLGQPNHRSVKLVASVAHVYGRKVVGAESFTGQTKWQEHPYAMKTLGDYMYTQGLNCYVFHRYCHQPHPDAAPGMTMGPWGWFFDRTNTWFEKSGAWLQYVARAQNMLRQGLFVADVLYFTGEDSPVVAPGSAQLEPPPGYDWDTIDAGAIQARIKIENGRIVLPDGMSYRVLVLRDDTKLSVPVLRKLRDLVNQGLWLAGPKPAGSPSLSDDDAEVRRLAAEVWGDLNGTTVTEREFGKGRVFWGQPARAVLDKLNLRPDFECTSRSGDAPIHWIHRRAGDAEIYFVANQRRRSEDLVCTFRVSGKQPEFWDAVTGQIAKVATYEIAGGRTRVPVRLEPAGSVFVVFRSPAPAQHLQAIAKDGAAILTTQPFAKAAPGLHRKVANNFTVAMWVKPDMDTTIPTIGTAARGGGFGMRGGPSFVFFPPPGETAYGANHAACGLAAGRNGLALYERTTGNPAPVVAAPMPVAGWTHVAVVYRDGAPSLYVDGKPAGQAPKSGKLVHPGLGESQDAPVDFMGQMTEPELFTEALSEARIRQLTAAGLPKPEDPPPCEPAGSARAELLYWENGNYSLRDGAGRTSSMQISGLGKAVEVTGPWRVTFPPDLGAPTEITMPELMSLHRHSEPGVKYFSGTATYITRFSLPAGATAGGKRLFLDLGRVEVIAEVKLNGKPIGNLWKFPYRLDITDAVRSGDNDLQIQVTNLWPNRLIGDEQLPAEYEYGGGMGGPGGGGFGAAPGTGGILRIPDWYAQGKPKPPSRRVAFTTWKWYSKDDPLLESGLLGPVRLRTAIRRALDL